MAEDQGSQREGRGMRLNAEEVAAIKEAAAETFGETAVVRLFGSRLRDSVRGGDIDLHLEVNDGQQDVSHAARFRWRVYEAIDEQKMDLVFHVRGRPARSIDNVAYREGIIL
jgi:predicted nucleotidyltransferase